MSSQNNSQIAKKTIGVTRLVKQIFKQIVKQILKQMFIALISNHLQGKSLKNRLKCKRNVSRATVSNNSDLVLRCFNSVSTFTKQCLRQMHTFIFFTSSTEKTILTRTTLCQ